MQQIAPQPNPAGFPGFMPPGAQPGQPLYQPGGQSLFQPGGQPLFQPGGQPLFQPGGQPPYQAGGQPGGQQQAAPVAPVAAPTYAPPGAAPQAGQQQQPQNPYARPAISIARTLEQAIPGFQLLISVVQDLAASPRGESVAATRPAVLEIMRELTFQHYSALGAIRRVLCNETTSEVAMALAVPVNQLLRLHSQLRQHVDRLVIGAAPELRSTLAGLAQAGSSNDLLLQQAAGAVQQLFGPQIWEAARGRVFAGQSQPGI